MIQQLCPVDYRKLRAMLRSDVIQGMPEYEDEIRHMLDGNIKCELEALYGLGLEAFSTWILDRLQSADYI